MRIAMMLRSLDERFGIGVYTRNILDSILELGHGHQFILFFRSEKHLGKYASHPNVEEVLVRARSKLLWDQVAIPLASKRAKADVLFHTKFTVPLFNRTKTAMVLHGASWFVHPELYQNKLDLLYIRMMMPLYCRRADAIIANSDLTRRDFIDKLRVPPAKIRTIYFGRNPTFKQIEDRNKLAEVRSKYDLPDHFILTVSRYDPRKNFCTIFEAFTKCRDAGVLKLVAVGKDSWRYKSECGIVRSGFENDLIFPGYIEQEDLPAFYNLATVFLFPSVYEEFGIPLVEAMACGCPVVASNTGAMPEITAGAALLADPFDAHRMAQDVDRLVDDIEFREAQIEKGLKRARQFSWQTAAQETLEVLESL